MRRNNELIHVSLWLALAGVGAPALAEPADWTPVDEDQLEQMRGGFGNAAGLAVSLGIERLVSINGEVVSRTHIEIADLKHLNAEQVRLTGDALSSIKLIQNGRDNIYEAGESARVAGGVVIQNTLNDQLIRSQTVISSTVNSASLLKSINFQATLSDALSRAAGPR